MRCDSVTSGARFSDAMTGTVHIRGTEPETPVYVSLKGTAVMHSMLLIFNNVLAPCFATMLVDGSCFAALVIAPDAIESSYSYPLCEQFNVTSSVCISAVVVESAEHFTPPFIYSYQCSSSLLVQYVPLFLAL